MPLGKRSAKRPAQTGFDDPSAVYTAARLKIRCKVIYIESMRHFIAICVFGVVLSSPAVAEEAPSEDGGSLLERGAEMMLEGLLQEMEPALDDLQALMDEMQPQLRGFIDQMGPALADLLAQVEDITAYHPPEILPNGDIILRRKTPEEIEEVPDSGDDIEI